MFFTDVNQLGADVLDKLYILFPSAHSLAKESAKSQDQSIKKQNRIQTIASI